MIKMYVTLMPSILAGIFNMIWCKVPILKKINVPIDHGRTLKDGKRMLGDNKTWKGFLGYIVLNIFFAITWGIICHNSSLMQKNFFYVGHANTLFFNLLIGLLLGFFYALFELPNSFLKRRIGIEPGKPAQGIKKIFFICLDQADSPFGVCLVVAMFYPMTIGFYLLYVLVASVTHLVFNMLLYFLKLRKNIF